MGTRSLTILAGREAEIAVIYRQFDGYPEGHGRELAGFLAGYRVVNGYARPEPKLANGMDCLAAQIVALLKTDVGNVYLLPAGKRDCGEEFRYHVLPGDDEPRLRIETVSHTGRVKLLHDGTATETLAWIDATWPKRNSG